MTHRKPKQTHILRQHQRKRQIFIISRPSVKNKMLRVKNIHMCSHYWAMIIPDNKYAKDATFRKYDWTLIWIIAHLFLVDNVQVTLKELFKAALTNFLAATGRDTSTQPLTDHHTWGWHVSFVSQLTHPEDKEQHNQPTGVMFVAPKKIFWVFKC